jgi:hypothetical protein
MEIPSYVTPVDSFAELPFDPAQPVTFLLGGGKQSVIVPPASPDTPEDMKFGLQNHLVQEFLNESPAITLVQNDIHLTLANFMGRAVMFDANKKAEIIEKLEALLQEEQVRIDAMVDSQHPAIPDYITPVNSTPYPFDMTKPIEVTLPQPDLVVKYTVSPTEPATNEPLWFLMKIILEANYAHYLLVEQGDIKYRVLGMIPGFGMGWVDQKYSIDQIKADTLALL